VDSRQLGAIEVELAVPAEARLSPGTLTALRAVSRVFIVDLWPACRGDEEGVALYAGNEWLGALHACLVLLI
jgi:hypothetical protein